MPLTRSAAAQKSTVVSSDDADDEAAAPRNRPKRKSTRARTSSGLNEAQRKRNKTGTQRERNGPVDVEIVVDVADQIPSTSTDVVNAARAKLRSSTPGSRLSFEENCLAEVTCLRAKYGEDDCGYGVKMTSGIPITSISVTISPLLDEQIRAYTLVLVKNPTSPQRYRALKFFPPIRVQLDVSKNSSKLIIHASWLLKAHLKTLTKKADTIFRQHNGNAPFTAVLSWLEKNAVKSIGLLRGREISYVAAAVTPAKKQVHQIEFQDLDPIREIFFSTQYRRAAIAKCPDIRDISTFDCTICFDHKSTMMAAVFPTCGHYFCINCVREDFSLKVRENRVKELWCLAEGCHAPSSPEMIKFLLNKDSFKRYCDLISDTVVEGASFVRCPQRNCNVPVELAPDARREVKCPTCQFKFCSTCKAKPHPNKPCLTDEQKKEIREAYTNANAGEKKALEERYGMSSIKFALEDHESATWITKNAKPCPKCKIPIEKMDGCNKMVCTAKGCNAYFCWLCGIELKNPNPYLHFQSGACNGRLHEGQRNLDAPPNPALLGLQPGFDFDEVMGLWDGDDDEEDFDAEPFHPGIPWIMDDSSDDEDDYFPFPGLNYDYDEGYDYDTDGFGDGDDSGEEEEEEDNGYPDFADGLGNNAERHLENYIDNQIANGWEPPNGWNAAMGLDDDELAVGGALAADMGGYYGENGLVDPDDVDDDEYGGGDFGLSISDASDNDMDIEGFDYGDYY
ncbi:putative E3 ubiquitin-protein ligase RNF14 [Hypsibius exemplaris]|uniref:RBR-type E3 ubiquitin transferase n=1 Tax=Hypsibius exemplaris TaxID=2072580 RepID=A0A1W0X6E5_HYPEX|nr:putative E3 ubiquitin-protein ligase RNF14 [Hypsibius exemplaris]